VRLDIAEFREAQAIRDVREREPGWRPRDGVTLGPGGEVDPGRPLAFDSQLDTPNRWVTISNVYREIALKEPVRTTRTRVRIWVNRLREPDRIIVGPD
jgi:hypothetical protein